MNCGRWAYFPFMSVAENNSEALFVCYENLFLWKKVIPSQHCPMSRGMTWKVVFWVFRFQIFFHVHLPLLYCMHRTIVRKLSTVLNCITFFSFPPCFILEANLILHLGRLDKWSCSKSCVWKQGRDRLEDWKSAKTNLSGIA